MGTIQSSLYNTIYNNADRDHDYIVLDLMKQHKIEKN